MKTLLIAATALMLGTSFAAATTNYVETPHGFYSYHAEGMGNAANQTGSGS